MEHNVNSCVVHNYQYRQRLVKKCKLNKLAVTLPLTHPFTLPTLLVTKAEARCFTPAAELNHTT